MLNVPALCRVSDTEGQMLHAMQAADEGKQIVTYGRDYFNSPWNYMDLASCCIIAILFLLHISRLNHQLFVILVALEVLLLCLRSLYFCMVSCAARACGVSLANGKERSA